MNRLGLLRLAYCRSFIPNSEKENDHISIKGKDFKCMYKNEKFVAIFNEQKKIIYPKYFENYVNSQKEEIIFTKIEHADISYLNKQRIASIDNIMDDVDVKVYYNDEYYVSDDNKIMLNFNEIIKKINENPKFYVELNPRLLKFIDNQTEELCLFAVKKDAYCLIFVKEQTFEICKEACLKNINVIVYVKNPKWKLEIQSSING
jgi:hypothetical protein